MRLSRTTPFPMRLLAKAVTGPQGTRHGGSVSTRSAVYSASGWAARTLPSISASLASRWAHAIDNPLARDRTVVARPPRSRPDQAPSELSVTLDEQRVRGAAGLLHVRALVQVPAFNLFLLCTA